MPLVPMDLVSALTYVVLGLANARSGRLCPKYKGKLMTPIEIRAAHRIGIKLLRQSKEKMRDQLQNLAQAEA